MSEAPLSIQINPLHGEFAAEILDCDITQQVTPALHDEIEAAMARYAVVVIRGQEHPGDADQIRFSRAFGPLELPPELGMADPDKLPRMAREVYDVSNLDEHGALDAPDSLRRRFVKGNENFHTDSSFNDLPTKWSLLLAHKLPATGGDTEFVDTRAAYRRLPQALKEQIEELQVEHSLARSRAKGGIAETSVFARAFPPVVQPLVRTSASGDKALYIGAHAAHILGMDEQAGRSLLDELIERATRAEHIYSHKWLAGDMVIWDNRCTMHRATQFDYMKDRRDLRRTTINEFGEERRGSRAPS